MLKLYWILRSPTDETILLAERFSIWAFLFTWIWALTNKLWNIAGILLAAQLFIGLIAQKFSDYFLVEIVQILIMIICGIYATSWQVLNYLEKKYQIVDVVYAENEVAANLKFFDNQLKRSAKNDKNE